MVFLMLLPQEDLPFHVSALFLNVGFPPGPGVMESCLDKKYVHPGLQYWPLRPSTSFGYATDLVCSKKEAQEKPKPAVGFTPSLFTGSFGPLLFKWKNR